MGWSASAGELYVGNRCSQTRSNSSADKECWMSFHAGCTGTSQKPACKMGNAKPGENLRVVNWRKEVTSPPSVGLLWSLLWNCLQDTSPALPSGDGAGEALRSSTKRRGIMAWSGWTGSGFFFHPEKGHWRHRRAQACGEAVETMHLKSGLVAQGWDYLLYLSAFENSPSSELNSRSEQACEAGLQTCSLPLPPACAGKKHFLTETSMELSLCEHCKYIYLYMKQLV